MSRYTLKQNAVIAYDFDTQEELDAYFAGGPSYKRIDPYPVYKIYEGDHEIDSRKVLSRADIIAKSADEPARKLFWTCESCQADLREHLEQVGIVNFYQPLEVQHDGTIIYPHTWETPIDTLEVAGFRCTNCTDEVSSDQYKAILKALGEDGGPVHQPAADYWGLRGYSPDEEPATPEA